MLTGRKDTVACDSLRNGIEEEERKEHPDNEHDRHERESSQDIPSCVRRIIYGLRERFSPSSDSQSCRLTRSLAFAVLVPFVRWSVMMFHFGGCSSSWGRGRKVPIRLSKR